MDDKSPQKDLDELERVNPRVREAKKQYMETVETLNFRARIDARRKAEGKPPLRGFERPEEFEDDE